MRTLLTDADIIAYKVAAVCEEKFDWGTSESAVYVVDEEKARREADRIVNEIADTLNAHQIVICLSDPVANWRKHFDPTYKDHRVALRKPELLMYVKRYLAESYESFIRDRLEADDVMGILATTSSIIKGEKVMVSEDKDMRSIPGLLYNPNRSELGVIEINELDADRFHMWQTVCGDQSDGVPGCPGAGPTAAEEIPFADRDELWDMVLFEYNTRGYTEDDAIHQARLLHILRATDYNFVTKKVRLWEPTWLVRS
jgi:DNA polymerase-1